MSVPISECRINAAALGNEDAFKGLVAAMAVNMKRGAYSIFPCPHDPPCAKATKEQCEAVEARVLAAVREIEVQARRSYHARLNILKKL
jgi:hypothetical protein